MKTFDKRTAAVAVWQRLGFVSLILNIHFYLVVNQMFLLIYILNVFNFVLFYVINYNGRNWVITAIMLIYS